MLTPSSELDRMQQEESRAARFEGREKGKGYDKTPQPLFTAFADGKDVDPGPVSRELFGTLDLPSLDEVLPTEEHLQQAAGR